MTVDQRKCRSCQPTAFHRTRETRSNVLVPSSCQPAPPAPNRTPRMKARESGSHRFVLVPTRRAKPNPGLAGEGVLVSLHLAEPAFFPWRWFWRGRPGTRSKCPSPSRTRTSAGLRGSVEPQVALCCQRKKMRDAHVQPAFFLGNCTGSGSGSWPCSARPGIGTTNAFFSSQELSTDKSSACLSHFFLKRICGLSLGSSIFVLTRSIW